jgi:nicotinate-nucleotide adenylyltransferase
MIIGLLGGTFDPPHIGHLKAAESVLKSGLVDKILIVPSSHPPHKLNSIVSPATTRMEMANLLTAGHPELSVSDIEFKREGPSYTVDTIRCLQKAHPNDCFRIIIGADMALEFPSWREAATLAEIARPIVLERPGSPLPEDLCQILPEPIGDILQQGRIPFEKIAVSSTRIREKANSGEDISDMTLPSIAEYIKRHKLYA